MAAIGIFYGSTTGNTETLMESIQEMMGEERVVLHDVCDATVADVNGYQNLVFAIPTWDIGELQEDWVDWIENIDDADMQLSGKKVAVIGVGDQEGYPDTFGDAMGMVYDKLKARGAALVIDRWSKEGYEFDDSKGVRDGHLVGLMLDEDSQPEKSEERLRQWVKLAAETFD